MIMPRLAITRVIDPSDNQGWRRVLGHGMENPKERDSQDHESQNWRAPRRSLVATNEARKSPVETEALERMFDLCKSAYIAAAAGRIRLSKKH